MDILKRSLAPMTDAAWDAVRKEATRALSSQLSARKIVDVVGPKGLDFAAVGLGRLEVSEVDLAPGSGKMCYGVHKVLPLVEVRASFEMNIWSLDDVERGAKDIDFAPVVDAAKDIAGFEERAVYQGFSPAGIGGMASAKEGPGISLGTDVSRYPDVVVQSLLKLREREIEGPYALVLGSRPFRILQGSYSNYPVRKQVEQVLGGPIVHSPFIDDGFVVSTRGGDLELTLGQDLSLGYETHDTKVVRLYLSESFTFRVLEPRAIVRLQFAEKPLRQTAVEKRAVTSGRPHSVPSRETPQALKGRR